MEINEYNAMLCPVCGNEYTHLYKVEEYEEKDGRECVKLHFYCEGECYFVIDFHQHEGMTFINTERYKKVLRPDTIHYAQLVNVDTGKHFKWLPKPENLL